MLAHTKFVSAEISGGKMDKEKGGTPVRGTFKLIIGDTVKEYPVAGFVSSEKGTVSLDLSQAKARLAGDVAEGMTGADVKKFLVSEYSAATGLDERSSATLRYLLHKTDDEFFEKIAPRSARRTK